MIDLTPLDVRKKRGDFGRAVRGYDREEVDHFLEMVAERLEALVKENMRLRERADRLQGQLAALEGRENAVHEALVTAQELREEMRQQARREAELLRREAEAEVDRALAEGERQVRSMQDTVEGLERARLRYLKAFRSLLERNLDALEVEEERSPLDDAPLEIEFSVSAARERIRSRILEERAPDDEDRGSAGAGAAAAAGGGGALPPGDDGGEAAPEEAGPGEEEPGEEEAHVGAAARNPEEGAAEEEGEAESDEDEPSLWLPSLEDEEELR